VNTTKKIQTFINNCLRMILQIRWSDNISNEELWQRKNQNNDWRWIGHTLRKPAIYAIRQALRRNLQGKRKVGQTMKHLRPRPRERCKEDGPHMGAGGETRRRQKAGEN
jgi:hypothetical protein